MKEEDIEKLGLLIDKLENLIQAMTMPLPDSIHIQGIKPALPEILNEVKAVYLDEGGENWWDE